MSRPLKEEAEGRRLNADDPKLWLSFNERQRDAINTLVDAGFHGNTPAACVMRLLDEAIRIKIEAGLLLSR